MKKKAPDAAETPPDPWKEKLQATLKKDRPSSRRWGLWLSLGLLAVLVLLAWWLYPRPTPPLPALITFDALIVPGEEAPLLALFDKAEDQPAPRYKGRTLTFQESRLPSFNEELGSASVTLGEEGTARASLKVSAKLRKVAFKAQVLEKARQEGAKDEAHCFSFPADSNLLLVCVEGTLSRFGVAEWDKANLNDVVPVPEAPKALQDARKRGFEVAYLALEAEKPAVYRKMRLWVHSRSGEGDSFLPEGPVLGRPDYSGDVGDACTKVLAGLKDRFTGRRVALTGDASSAARLRAAGWRTILVGDGEPLDNIERIRSWDELGRVVEKK
jgi:hypothetical protein